MANPRVLLLDEPSEGFAPVVIDQIVETLRQIRVAGTCLVVVEQHLSMVRRVADRFAALVKGGVRPRARSATSTRSSCAARLHRDARGVARQTPDRPLDEGAGLCGAVDRSGQTLLGVSSPRS